MNKILLLTPFLFLFLAAIPDNTISSTTSLTGGAGNITITDGSFKFDTLYISSDSVAIYQLYCPNNAKLFTLLNVSNGNTSLSSSQLCETSASYAVGARCTAMDLGNVAFFTLMLIPIFLAIRNRKNPKKAIYYLTIGLSLLTIVYMIAIPIGQALPGC